VLYCNVHIRILYSHVGTAYKCMHVFAFFFVFFLFWRPLRVSYKMSYILYIYTLLTVPIRMYIIFYFIISISLAYTYIIYVRCILSHIHIIILSSSVCIVRYTYNYILYRYRYINLTPLASRYHNNKYIYIYI